MRIALFSDIHANLPALESFFENLETQKVDMLYCLGDLVGYNIWPNEVIEEIRKRRIPCIAGNYDFGIGVNGDDCGCAYKTEEDQKNGNVSISFTNSIVNEENRNYLSSLPRHIRLELEFGGEKQHLLLVHGSPRKINEYLFEDRKETSFMRIFESSKADILCFGHTHKPFHRRFEKDGVAKHAINIGSIGKPKDGDARGGYVILDWNESLSPKKPENLKVEFVRFAYDIEKAAKAVEDSILPNVYAEALRKAE